MATRSTWPLRDLDALQRDLMAGLTTGVMLVPQSMAYALLAGLAPINGLYAALAGSFVYALFGSSRQLSVGPVAVDSMLTASALSGLHLHTPGEHAAAAALLALMVGAVQGLLSLLRAGFVVNFLSRPVGSGFTSGAAIVIATSQLPELLGVKLPRESVFVMWGHALAQLGHVHVPTLLLGLASSALLLVVARVTRRVPGPLVLVLCAGLLALLFDLGGHGFALVGHVPTGLPSLALPSLEPAWLRQLAPAALTIALVSYTESITTATTFARAHHYELAPNRELGALGFANLASGLCGGYPIAGGLSRSAVHDRAGARSQLAGLCAALVVLASLLFFTPAFRALPRVALAAIVLSAVLSLFDLKTARELYRVKRSDFWLLIVTFAATLLWGVSLGVMCGIGASLLLFLVRDTRPHYAVLGNMPNSQAWLNVARHANARSYEGVLVVRMDAQLYFGNVSFLRETLRAHEQRASGGLRAIVLDASGVNQLDSSALEALEELDRDYTARGMRLLFSRVKGPVRDVLERAGMLARLRQERRIFTRTHDAAECARLYVAGSLAPCSISGGDLSEGVDVPREGARDGRA